MIALIEQAKQASLKFGPTAENGLRVAGNRYPARDTYLVGDVVYSSLVSPLRRPATGRISPTR